MSQTHQDTRTEKAEAKVQAKAEADAQHEAEAKAEAQAKAKAKADAAKRDAQAKAKARHDEARAKVKAMPTGGTIIAAAPGYSVLTAVKPPDPGAVLTFPPSLVVIAWSIGSDGVAWPITAIPPSEHAIDIGTVHSNGAVVDLDGTVYAGPVEWQAAVSAREGPQTPPVNVDRPYLQQAGSLLTCTMGNWEDPPPTSYSYGWQRDGMTIGDASPQYTVTGDDVGKSFVCTVTASNSLGSTAAVSNPVVVAAQ